MTPSGSRSLPRRLTGQRLTYRGLHTRLGLQSRRGSLQQVGRIIPATHLSYIPDAWPLARHASSDVCAGASAEGRAVDVGVLAATARTLAAQCQPVDFAGWGTAAAAAGPADGGAASSNGTRQQPGGSTAGQAPAGRRRSTPKVCSFAGLLHGKPHDEYSMHAVVHSPEGVHAAGGGVERAAGAGGRHG
jgi:hypothetical protein